MSVRSPPLVNWAYSDGVNGELPDGPVNGVGFEPKHGIDKSYFEDPHRVLARDYDQKPLLYGTPVILVLIAGFLLGGLVSSLLRPSRDEQLAAARAEIAERNDRIRVLEGELNRVPRVAQDIAKAEQSLADQQAQLDARERALNDRQEAIAQREKELASRWTVPKPSSQQVLAFFKSIDDTISRLLNAERRTVPCRC